MKKFLLTLLAGAAATCGALAQGYTFAQSTGTYADLVSPTVVSTPGWDPSDAFTIPIGFNFVLDGATFTSLETDGLGDLNFGTGTGTKAIYPFDGIVIDRGYPSTTSNMSPISYQLSGTTGSRILKIEFKNASTADPVSGTLYPNDFVNFQVWLYEGTNKVEVRYGSSSLTHATNTFFGASGPTEAIVTNITQTPFSISGHFLTGPANAATLTTLTNASTYGGLSSIPANGTIYAFTPAGTTGISKDLDNGAVSIFPNPATDKLHIAGLAGAKTPATVRIFDALGKVVQTEELAASQTVNINALPKGTYFMEIVSGSSRIGKQVIKL